jgi:hypothetical protein
MWYSFLAKKMHLRTKFYKDVFKCQTRIYNVLFLLDRYKMNLVCILGDYCGNKIK